MSHKISDTTLQKNKAVLKVLRRIFPNFREDPPSPIFFKMHMRNTLFCSREGTPIKRVHERDMICNGEVACMVNTLELSKMNTQGFRIFQRDTIYHLVIRLL